MKRKIFLASALVFGLASSTHVGGQGIAGGLDGGWIAPIIILAAMGYVITRQVAPPQCGYVQEQVTDEEGRPLRDRYGRPRTRVVYVCPSARPIK